MAMRAGSYNAAKPKWRGVIRDKSYPAYVCEHDTHPDQHDATLCAREAHRVITETSTLPRGWVPFDPQRHRDL